MIVKLRLGNRVESVELGQGWKKLRRGYLRQDDEYYHPATKTWRKLGSCSNGKRNCYMLVRRLGYEPGSIPDWARGD